MSTVDLDRRSAGRRKLIGVAAVFFVPFFGAWVWFFNVETLRPDGGANHGELIEPARPLTTMDLTTADGRALDGGYFERTWTLVHVVGPRCAEQCERNLYHTRQVRIALGRDVQRVKRLLLAADAASLPTSLAAGHPDLVMATAPGLVAQIRAAVEGMPPREQAVYLLDPLLNLMMRFPADLDPRLMIKDLKKLLKISQIG